MLGGGEYPEPEWISFVAHTKAATLAREFLYLRTLYLIQHWHLEVGIADMPH